MRTTKIISCLMMALLLCTCTSNVKSQKERVESLTETSLSDQKKGRLFIIGGGKRPVDLVQKLIDISPIDSGSYIMILPMASVEPDSSVFYASKQFTELGINSEKIKSYNFKKKEQNLEQLELLRNAGLIYIPGGDQNTFMDVVGGSTISEAIKKAYRNGATIAGTSAGAAVMSKKMITGNEYKHPEYTGDFRTIESDNIELSEGLGLIENAIIDQHFIRRMRMNRLISTAIENPNELSIGIDESTAILVENDSAEVIGVSQVVVLRANSNNKNVKNGLLGAKSLDLSILLPGERFAIHE